jgi:prepilin-type N-terminal cleavage/methylation domain-containing protein
MKTLTNKKGFTLIELLIAVAIIGVLATVVLASLGSAREATRDARRLSDVRQIQTALEMHIIDNNRYPGTNHSGSSSSWENSIQDNADFIDALADDGYMSIVPVDPINVGDHHYRYYRYPAGSFGCPVSNGAFYVLGIHDMERSGRPHPKSPGWRCSSRNWQGEFDWVVGRFENP